MVTRRILQAPVEEWYRAHRSYAENWLSVAQCSTDRQKCCDRRIRPAQSILEVLDLVQQSRVLNVSNGSRKSVCSKTKHDFFSNECSSNTRSRTEDCEKRRSQESGEPHRQLRPGPDALRFRAGLMMAMPIIDGGRPPTDYGEAHLRQPRGWPMNEPRFQSSDVACKC